MDVTIEVPAVDSAPQNTQKADEKRSNRSSRGESPNGCYYGVPAVDNPPQNTQIHPLETAKSYREIPSTSRIHVGRNDAIESILGCTTGTNAMVV